MAGLLLLAALALTACDQYRATDGPDASTTPALTPAPSGGAEAVADGCAAVGGVGGEVAVETLLRPDRSCVPASEAVVFRCEPAADPVAILDAGGDRRVFLGGSRAVPVEGVPAEAAAVGFGPSGRFLAVPGEPLLYLESGGTLERWLALARPGRVAEPPSALLVGDSILEGSAEPLAEALTGWTTTVDAVVGRSSFGGVAVVEAAAAPPDAVVVELGTNDHDAAAFRANADRILAAPAVTGADLVVWVTAHNPEEVTPAVNREIARAVAALPHATIADWDRAVPPEALNGDGVHLALGNEHVFADFLAPILETWRGAIHREGPTACTLGVLRAAGIV